MKSPQEIAITERFNSVFRQLHASVGHGMKARFCRDNGINCNQLNALLKRPETRTLPPYYIACLCRDYGVSTDWILLGVGEMTI
jgi:hypothetical protein